MASPRQEVREQQPEDLWSDGGVWEGPHDLRFFLRSPGTWFFALWWLFILTFISIAFIASVLPPSFWGWFTPLLALAISGPLTLASMFCFSRGWIGDGD